MQGLRDMVQEQEVQTLFPAYYGAPLFPTSYFFYLLTLQTPPDGCHFSKNTVLAAEVIDWNAIVWAAQSSQVLHYRHEALGRFAYLKQKSALQLVTRCSLALLSMESQSIQSMESKVIHLFLKETVKPKQINCIIKTLIFSRCLECPMWQLAFRSLLCKYWKWGESNPTTALMTFPCPDALCASQGFAGAACPTSCSTKRVERCQTEW